MLKRSRIALKVHNLADSLEFYIHRLEAELIDAPSDADMALIQAFGDTLLLLAGPSTEDVRNLLSEPRIVFKPGDTLDLEESDLDTRIFALSKKGLYRSTTSG